MRRLLPTPADHVTVLDAYTHERRAHPSGRPWVGLCMVASIDGAIAVDGASAGLSNTTDSEVLHTLRQLADVIVVGAGTVRSEGYGQPKKSGQRVGVVSGSGDVDLSTPLFTSGAGFVICSESAPRLDVDTLRVGATRVDLAAALDRIHELAPGATFVQAEGGAGLNGSLLDADLIDEINLTTSPRLVGGTSPRLTATEHQHDRRYEIGGLFTDDEGFVFTRWVRRPAC
jgi:riboflavin biosynthesis pyrimidine reductase